MPLLLQGEEMAAAIQDAKAARRDC